MLVEILTSLFLFKSLKGEYKNEDLERGTIKPITRLFKGGC